MSTIINIMLGTFLLMGIVWGMWRGALKSFVRLSFLVLNCVFWLVVTPNISHFLLTVNLNPLLNVTIGSETYHTIGELLNHFLQTNDIVLSIMGSSQIMTSFIEQIPYIVANFIVFMLGYFLVKVITFPIYDYLMNKILKLFQNNNQDEPKTIRNMVFGGLFGLLQSVLTAIILFLPISTLSAVIQMDTSNLLNNSTTNSQTVNMGASQTASATTSAPNNEFTTLASIYSNTLFFETFHSMKLNVINEFMFTRLTSIEVNGTKLSLAKEVKNLTTSVNDVKQMLKEQNLELEKLNELNETQLLSLLDSLDYNKLEKTLTTLLNLKTLEVLGDELLTYAYAENAVQINELLNTLPKPILPIIENLMLSAKTGNSNLLAEDIYNLFQIIKTLKENNLFAFTQNKALMNRLQTALDTNNNELMSASIKEISFHIIETLAPYSEQQIKEQLIEPLFKAQTQRRLMKDLLNVVIDVVNKNFNTNVQKISRISVSWTNETLKLSKIAYALKESAHSLLPYMNNEPLEFNATTINKLPLQQVGILLNTLRESQLLSYLYVNVTNELLNTYLFSLEYNENPALVFVELNSINWEQELTLLQHSIIQLMNAVQNYNLSASINLELSLTNLLTSKLAQEVLVQASGVIPTVLVEQMKEYADSPELAPAFNNLTKSLQALTPEQLKNDLIHLAKLFDELNNTTGKPFTEFLLGLNQAQVHSLVTQLTSSNIIKNMLPEVINLFIANVNKQYDVSIQPLPDSIYILETDNLKLSNAIYAIKTVYLQLTNSDLNLKKLDLATINASLNTIELEKIGYALDQLKQISFLKNTYSSLLLQTIFNKQFITQWIPSNYLPYYSFNLSQINQISWEQEVNMAKNALSIATTMQSIEEKGYDSIFLNEFLTNYGNSILLKTGFMNGVAYLYPETNFTVLNAFNLQQNAQAIGGIGEFIFQFLDFKYNGVVKFESLERYRIREGFKKLGANTDMVALIEELTGVSNLDYNQIAFVADVLYDVLEGKEFALKAFAPYLDATPLIPWVVDLIQKISEGYKMPYYLNIYMNVNITKIKLYGIHLGKSSMETDKGENKPVNITEMLDLLEYLAYVPDFITAKFIFDPTFTQPIKNNIELQTILLPTSQNTTHNEIIKVY